MVNARSAAAAARALVRDRGGVSTARSATSASGRSAVSAASRSATVGERPPVRPQQREVGEVSRRLGVAAREGGEVAREEAGSARDRGMRHPAALRRRRRSRASRPSAARRGRRRSWRVRHRRARRARSRVRARRRPSALSVRPSPPHEAHDQEHHDQDEGEWAARSPGTRTMSGQIPSEKSVTPAGRAMMMAKKHTIGSGGETQRHERQECGRR